MTEKIIQIATLPGVFNDGIEAIIPWVYGLGDKGTLFRAVLNDEGITEWSVYIPARVG